MWLRYLGTVGRLICDQRELVLTRNPNYCGRVWQIDRWALALATRGCLIFLTMRRADQLDGDDLHGLARDL